MKPFNQKIHDFWFESAPATRVGILRILLGCFMVYFLVSEESDFLRINRTDPRLFDPVGVIFHGPISPELFLWLVRATILGSICFTLGLWHRITGPLFAGLFLWLMCYRQSWGMIYHSFNLMVLHVGVLGCTRSADVLSLDAFLRDMKNPDRTEPVEPSWRYGWPVNLMNAITVGAYFLSAMAKLAGPLGLAWLSGQSLRSQVAVDGMRKELLGVDPNPVSYTLYGWLPLFTLLAVMSMCVEFLAPLALFNRRFAKIWAVNAFMMHWGILFMMGITFEHHLSGLVFAPFFRVERILDFARKLRRSRAGAEGLPSPGLGEAVTPGTRHALVYYDGDCGLCDRFVQFVLRHDARGYFNFATLQSIAGRKHLSRLGLPVTELRTVILVEEGHSFARSTATLRVCRKLSKPWSLLYWFIVVPLPWRDATYSLVARNRKRWFKPPAECPVMPPEWRSRFVG